MRTLQILFFLFFTNILFAQYYNEELVEIEYETGELFSIKEYLNIPYIDQMLGGVAINFDDNYYTFTGQGGDTKLYTADISTGELLYEVDVPQIQMLQYQGSDELVGISKGNPTGEVSLATINYKTGQFNTFPQISELADAAISTHNSAIDLDENIFYFVGSLSGTNIWSIVAIDITNGTLIKTIDISPTGEFLAGLAFDSQRKKLIGILNVTPGDKSIVEIDPTLETISEIQKITDLSNTFGGHRYWAYDDPGDKYFIIGLDTSGESYLYTLDSNTGNVLFKNVYDDDAWIMEEHSPLELRYSPNTQQLLGLRKGEPLPPVSISFFDASQKNINVFPNPVIDNKITIQLLGNEKIYSIKVINSFGKVLLENFQINHTQFEINTSKFSSGIYFVICSSEKRNYRRAFSINKK